MLLPSYQTDCSVIVTTRDRDLAHSIVVDTANIISLKPMQTTTSMALLADILDEKIISNGKETLTEICELLGHLPLALNIYAHSYRRRGLKTHQNALKKMRDIKNRLDILQVKDVAVRTAFEQSWGLLDEKAHTGFKTLAVFSGREFGLDAFAAIAGIGEFEAEELLDQLQTLFLIDLQDIMNSRYEQHDLLAAWAYEKLDGETQPYEAMSKYFYDFAVREKDNEDVLLPEFANVMAGMETGHDLGKHQRVLQYLDLLEPIWGKKGFFGAARRGYRLAFESAQELGKAELVAKIQLEWGKACIEQTAYEEALELLSLSQAYFQQTDDTFGLARSHFLVAKAKRMREEFSTAISHLQLAYSRFQELEDVENLSACLYEMGNNQFSIGNVQDAIDLGKDALKSHDYFDNPIEKMRCLNLIGLGYDETRQFEKATEVYAEIENFIDRIKNNIEISEYYYVYGYHLTCIDQFDESEKFLSQALNLFKKCGDRLSEANALNVKAINYLKRFEERFHKKDLELGRESAKDCVSIFEKIGNQFGIIYAGFTYGKLLFRSDEISAACKQVKQSFELADQLKNPYWAKLTKEWLEQRCSTTDMEA